MTISRRMVLALDPYDRELDVTADPDMARVMVLRTTIGFATQAQGNCWGSTSVYTSVSPGPVDGPWLREQIGDERYALLILAGELEPWRE